MAKVTDLMVKNIKNIEYVEIEAGGRINFIAGNNGAGKTSVVEAIFQAIDLKRYTKSGDAWKLIKKGEDNGMIKLTLEYKGDELEITRTFDKEKGVKMTAMSKTGMRLDQTFLNTLLGEFTVDPLAFSRMKPQEQIDVLKDIAGISTELIDKQIKDAFEERTIVNRKERELRAIVDKYSDGIQQVEKKSISKLSEAKQQAIDHNAKVTNAKDLLRRAETAIIGYDKELEQLEERKKALLANKELAERTIKENQEIANREIVPTDTLDQQIADIEENNEKAIKWETYQNRVKEHAETKQKADGMDEHIEGLRSKRIKMFVDAGLPIDGLGFDDEGHMLVNDVPFAQLSTGEQIKISTELATHDRPELKVLYIQDGSLLDDESLDIITKIADDRDYQIFVELVGEKQTKESVIILRGGKVLSDGNK